MATKKKKATKKKTVSLELTAKEATQLCDLIGQVRELKQEALEKELSGLDELEGKIDSLDLSKTEDYEDIW